MLMTVANVTFAQTSATQQTSSTQQSQTQQTPPNPQTEQQKGFMMFPDDANRILPYQLIYELKPGETVHDTLVLQNKDNFINKLFIYAVDNKGTDGKYDLKNSDEANTNKLVGTWVALPATTVALQPLETQIMPINITVPQDTPLGDYVGGIALEKRVPAKDYANVIIASRVTVKVNIKVTDNPQKVPKFSDLDYKLQQLYLPLSIWIFIIGILYYLGAQKREKHAKKHHGQKH